MIAALAVVAWLSVGASAWAVGPGVRAPASAVAPATYDSREAGPLTFRRSAPPATVAARESYEQRLGGAAAVTADTVTGALDAVARPGAALTSPSGGDRGAVARAWARSHLDVLGLSASDVDALGAPEVTRTAGGMAALRYVQTYKGIPAFDNALTVTLDRANRVVAAGGAPVASLAVASTTPKLSAEQAAAAIGATTAHHARLTIFTGASGPVLAWRMQVPVSGVEDYDAVVDATSGALLYRQNLVKFLDATVFNEYPGSAAGTSTVNLTPWLDVSQTTKLDGPYAHAYSDINDDDGVNDGEDVPPDNYGFHAKAGFGCSGVFLCSWTGAPNSWQDNREQNAVQAFALVNRFREHLAANPIGFNGDVAFEGDDRVLVETDDGASTKPNGSPDDTHLNNANMNTKPQGQSPRMQMYLFHGGGFRDINGGDDAATVWHEYTHGLSNRLITDADGVGALGTAQAGAMGEAWSDWYAEDHLVALGYEVDTADQGEIDLGKYSDATPHATRTEGMDCKPVSGQYPSPDPMCPGGAQTGPGGYTYADFGKIFAGGPEVHADGEIWGQTLWDLREALGSPTAEQVITQAMRISPPEPSMLDMRNAILAVTSNDFPGNLDAVWQVFADRGMGYYAATTGSSDVSPVPDVNPPPAPGSGEGTISGLITDARTGAPVAGATVGVAGHDTKLTGTYPAVGRLVATTGSDGRYTVAAPDAIYPRVVITGPEPYGGAVRTEVEVADGQATTLDVTLDFDWAFHKGLTTTDNKGAAFGCGAAQVVDHAASTVWSADNDHDPVQGAQVTVDLGQRVAVSAFGLDPGAGCGDDADAMTKSYRLDTSADGTIWATAKTGTFAQSDAGRITRITPDLIPARGARYVRLTLLEPRSSTSDYIDFAELQVYGAPAPDDPTTTTTTTTVPPTTQTTPTPTQTQTTTSTITTPRLAPPTLKALSKRGTKGAYKLTVVCPATCSVSTTMTITSALRRTLKLKKALVVTQKRTLLPGRKVLSLKVPGTVVKALKKRRRKALPATLKVVVSQSDGQTARATKKVSISLR